MESQRKTRALACTALYVALWTSIHAMIHARSFDNSESITFTVELCKLVASVVVLARQEPPKARTCAEGHVSTRKLFAIYTVPSGLYCVYNRMMHFNLSTFDPGTYTVLSQSRIVMTALVWRVYFKTRIVRRQWAAVCLITVGCILKETVNVSIVRIEAVHGLILVQMLCSVAAGIVTEATLKRYDGVPLALHNVCMYACSVVWNAVLLKRYSTVFDFSPLALSIILCTTLVGLLTSWMLKYCGSVSKSVASACESVLAVAVTSTTKGVPLKNAEWVATILVAAGTRLYHIGHSPSAAPRDPREKSK